MYCHTTLTIVTPPTHPKVRIAADDFAALAKNMVTRLHEGDSFGEMGLVNDQVR